MPPLGGVTSRFTGLTGQLLGQSLGYATGSAMAAALAPVVQPLANFAWEKNPALPIPAAIAATVALKHPGQLQAMLQEARLQGFDEQAFSAFTDAADNPPGLGELLELLRRNEISEAEFIVGLNDALIPARWHGHLASLEKVLLSPADLAMMRQQSFIDKAQQVARSSLAGVDATDAELLFQISGEPPGPETMIALWRRGLIDEGRVRQAVVEGRLKLKYVDDIVKLKEVPLSPAIAAEAVIRNRKLPREPHYYAAAAGISNADFDAWSDMLGRPIPVGEALTLARRGEFTFAQFKDAVARSDVRTEFADDLWKLRDVLPSLFELRRLIQEGAVTDAKATQIIIARGYDAEIAAGVVKAAHGQKNAKTKDLAVGQIEQLYEAGFEDRQWAVDGLIGLGYDATEADLHLTLVEARRLIGYLNAVIARIKAKYVGHQIALDDALAMLEAVGIAVEERQRYTDLWSAEREANVRRLTQAQVAKLVHLGAMPPAEGHARFIEMGFPPEDADWLLRLIKLPEASTPSPVS